MLPLLHTPMLFGKKNKKILNVISIVLGIIIILSMVLLYSPMFYQ